MTWDPNNGEIRCYRCGTTIEDDEESFPVNVRSLLPKRQHVICESCKYKRPARKYYVEWLKEFGKISDELVKLSVNISARTGKTKARKTYNAIGKVQRQVLDLKWDMENEMLKNHPHDGIMGY